MFPFHCLEHASIGRKNGGITFPRKGNHNPTLPHGIGLSSKMGESHSQGKWFRPYSCKTNNGKESRSQECDSVPAKQTCHYIWFAFQLFRNQGRYIIWWNVVQVHCWGEQRGPNSISQRIYTAKKKGSYILEWSNLGSTWYPGKVCIMQIFTGYQA